MIRKRAPLQRWNLFGGSGWKAWKSSGKERFFCVHYCVSHGNLQVFFDKLEDEAMEKWHETAEAAAQENYVCAYRPADCSVQCLRVFVKRNSGRPLRRAAKRRRGHSGKIHWEADDACPWQILSLYPLAASVDQAAGKLMEELACARTELLCAGGSGNLECVGIRAVA